MYAGNPVLDAVNVQTALGQLDLLPLQVADLRRPQAMAVGDQDHGRIPMPVAAMLSGAVHQPLNLALGEVSPLDCQVYDAWCAFLGCRFHADKLCLRASYCIGYTLFLHSRKGRGGCMERIAIAIQDGGAGAGAQHGCAGREANLILSCRRTSIWDPRGGETFWFQIFIQASSPEIWRKTISGGEGGCWRGKWGGLVLGYLLGKNFRQRDRDHLVPPRGMDAAVCCRDVLSFRSGARKASGSETARVHRVARRRCV